MPRPERLLWFINSARANHRPNANSLARKFNISVATAKRDVRFLKDELKAPLQYLPSQRGFTLSNRHWHLPLADRQVDTALAIATARHLLRAASPALELEFNAATARLEPDDPTTSFDSVLEVTSTRNTRHDPPRLRTLLVACSTRSRVAIAFSSVWSDTHPKWRDVDPWFIQRHDDHLYLHGFCHEARDARCFSLSGISAIREVDGPARREPRGFRKSVLCGLGVSRGQYQEATVRLFGSWARYASQEMWHPNQLDQWERDEKDSPVLRRTFIYALEAEAVRRLLCCGGEVEVRSPLSLRRALAAAFTAGAKRNASDGRETGAWSEIIERHQTIDNT